MLTTIAILLAAASLQAPQPRPAQTQPPSQTGPAARQPTTRRASAAVSAAASATRWMAVSAGASHTCALDITGLAHCWGDNASRRLGIADSVSRRRPAVVGTPTRFRVLSAGAEETCGVTEQGATVCWGGPVPGTPPRSALGDRVLRNIVLRGHTCAVDSAGGGWCWGANGSGQLGTGSTDTRTQSAPQPVAGGRRWRDIIPGTAFTCGLTTAGVVFCWGSDGAGQLGNGALGASREPSVVQGFAAGGATAIAVGDAHACALDSQGSAHCWGAGAAGRLGNGSTAGDAHTPQRVSGGLPFQAITAGSDFSCAIATDGKAWCWGNGVTGQLGSGVARSAAVPTLVRTGGNVTFTSISAGPEHACAVASDGGLWCWGANVEGQLGVARATTCRIDMGGGRAAMQPCATQATRVQEPR